MIEIKYVLPIAGIACKMNVLPKEKIEYLIKIVKRVIISFFELYNIIYDR